MFWIGPFGPYAQSLLNSQRRERVLDRVQYSYQSSVALDVAVAESDDIQARLLYWHNRSSTIKLYKS
jgi:hypothetical protein